jgi:hypothetical protein
MKLWISPKKKIKWCLNMFIFKKTLVDNDKLNNYFINEKVNKDIRINKIKEDFSIKLKSFSQKEFDIDLYNKYKNIMNVSEYLPEEIFRSKGYTPKEIDINLKHFFKNEEMLDFLSELHEQDYFYFIVTECISVDIEFYVTKDKYFVLICSMEDNDDELRFSIYEFDNVYAIIKCLMDELLKLSVTNIIEIILNIISFN